MFNFILQSTDLKAISNRYYVTLTAVNNIYKKQLAALNHIVTVLHHTDWNTFTDNEKKVTENTALLVGLLCNMCKVNIVLKGEGENNMNKVNTVDIEKSICQANAVLSDKFS